MAVLLQWRTLARLVLQLAVLALLLAAFFLRLPQVTGDSMEPGIRSGEYVLINTLAFRMGPPRRGEVVAFRSLRAGQDGKQAVFIKRVVGLAGDVVRVDRGSVYVDGTRLDEPYVRYPDDRSFSGVTIPPGSVYVLGDNRQASEDSRSFGPVPDSQLIGRALAGLWPPAMLGTL